MRGTLKCNKALQCKHIYLCFQLQDGLPRKDLCAALNREDLLQPKSLESYRPAIKRRSLGWSVF